MFYVGIPRLNARRAPRIEDGNIVDLFVIGDPLVVLADIAEQTADGWTWRRLADSDVWVAEANSADGRRLLDTAIPPVDESSEPQTLYALGTVRLRETPEIAGDNSIGQLTKDKSVQVLAAVRQLSLDGWVWRKLADQESTWIAEYNARSGKRLLSARPPTIVPDNAGTRPQVKGRVRVNGRQFLLDGKPFRFVGANLRELPFYARRDVLPYASEGNQSDQLNAMRDMGMHVVRMHACHRSVSLQDALPLLGKTLNTLQHYDMLAIVVLNDALGSFWVPGDERFHIRTLGHLDKTLYFHQEGYRENYLPYLEAVVAAYKDHPAIFAWELGNEYAIQPQPATPADSEVFLLFARAASDMIRSIDPTHLITTGLVNTGHVAPDDRPGLDRMAYGRRLYGLPNIDFVTVHFYEDNAEEQSSLPDLEIARQLDMPLIVEEWGATGEARAETTRSKLEFWISNGAAGFLQWGLSATPFNIGVGDNDRGMDTYAGRNKAHYQPTFNLYKEWSGRLKDS